MSRLWDMLGLVSSKQAMDDEIWRLWAQGLDTKSIAQKLFMKESEVHNRLLHIREQRKDLQRYMFQQGQPLDRA